MAAVVLHVTRPTKDSAHGGIEESGKRVGCAQSHFAVARLFRHFVALQERVYGDEAEVVVINGSLYDRYQCIGVACSRLVNSLAFVIGKGHPQDTGPEPRAPFFGFCLAEVPRGLSLENISWHHREVVGTKGLQGTIHLRRTVGERLSDERVAAVFAENDVLHMVTHIHRHVVGGGVPRRFA